MVMNESRSTSQPRKVEAYEWASRDSGAPAVILVRPYLDEVSWGLGATHMYGWMFGLLTHTISRTKSTRTLGAAQGRCSTSG